MKQIMALIMALALCILAIPAMAEGDEEPSDPKTLLSLGDNIWISISPMEAHPMYIDRPAPIIPTIPGYPIRVAVYSNPYNYSIINTTTGLAELVTIVDEGGKALNPFSVTSLKDLDITLRLPLDGENGTDPANEGITYSKVHMENDYKYEYVFYVRSFEGALNKDVERLFFVATNGEEQYFQGSGLVKITETSQSGGGKKGGNPEGTGGKDNNRNNGGGPDDSKPQGPKQGGRN